MKWIGNATAALVLSAVFSTTQAQTASRDVPEVDAQTEAIINGALKWLASKQGANGAWSIAPGVQGHPVAMTGYALMAFMACGQLPSEGEHARTVAAGMQYLLEAT